MEGTNAWFSPNIHMLWNSIKIVSIVAITNPTVFSKVDILFWGVISFPAPEPKPLSSGSYSKIL